ncbi:MAG: hypothetical protein IT431_15410 [Phycisphaerales bacterium]|nr:hypothetical protein [Phycisphaerales bacterium]
MRSGTLAVVMVAGLSGAARADVVFDFEELAGNSDPRAGDFRVLNLEAGGLFAVVQRTTNERFTVWDSAGQNVPSAWGAKHLSPVFDLLRNDYMQMSFSQGLRSVRIEFGDYGQDHDLAELWAYSEINLGGGLLGVVTGEMGDNDMRWDDPTGVTLFAPAGELIWSVKFRGGQDPFFQSTFIDNIVVDVAPAPGALGVIGGACAVAAGRVRRRR